MKKVLIIYASAGGGHYSAAKAIESVLLEKYPDYEPVIVDGPKAFGNKAINFFNDIYDYVLKTNIKYATFGFKLLNFLDGDKSLVSFFPQLIKEAAKKFKDINPDIVISVNSGINSFISEIYKELNWKDKKPFIIFVTDPTTGFVKIWKTNDVDVMYAPLEECKQQLIDYKMNPEKIRVIGGVPINPNFLKDIKTKEEAREYLQISQDKFTILLTSGGVGTNELSVLTRFLASSNMDLQIIVCCGRNEKLENELSEFSKSSLIPVKVMGFTDKMHTLMDASDIIIGKPGPGIIFEAITKGKPLILETVNGIMPQEEGNLNYALKNNIAFKAASLEDIIKNINLLMKKEIYQEMSKNTEKIAKPNAIYDLVEMIINFSENEFIKK